MRPLLKMRVGLLLASSIILMSCGHTVLALRPTVQRSHDLRIVQVIAEDAGATIAVSGRIVRGFLSRSTLAGHLDVVAQFLDNRPDLRVHSPFAKVNGPKSAYFRTELPISDAAAVSAITIAHARDHALADAPGKPS